VANKSQETRQDASLIWNNVHCLHVTLSSPELSHVVWFVIDCPLGTWKKQKTKKTHTINLVITDCRQSVFIDYLAIINHDETIKNPFSLKNMFQCASLAFCRTILYRSLKVIMELPTKFCRILVGSVKYPDEPGCLIYNWKLLWA